MTERLYLQTDTLHSKNQANKNAYFSLSNLINML